MDGRPTHTPVTKRQTFTRPTTPKPQSAPPNTVCDFEHQCYPEKGGPVVKAPVAPPVVATKPAAPRPTVPDDPLVAAWRDCIGQALQNYEQSHNLHALQVSDGKLSGSTRGAG